MFGVSPQDIFWGGVTIITFGGIMVYRLVTEPVEPKLRLYRPTVRCPFCGHNKKLDITKVCTQVSRLEGCEIISTDHRHVTCKNCDAQFIQRTTRWYD